MNGPKSARAAVDARLVRPRFSIAKYVGKYGGIDMRLGPKPNWDDGQQLIVDSYRIIAPKRLVRLLDEGQSGAPKKPAAKKPAAKKPASRKPTTKGRA